LAYLDGLLRIIGEQLRIIVWPAAVYAFSFVRFLYKLVRWKKGVIVFQWYAALV
jgi:hypothetical protein